MKEIVIKGSIDELVECEFYLIMVMGYDNAEDEHWNNRTIKYSNCLKAYSDKLVTYLDNDTLFSKAITSEQFLSQFK